MDKLNVRADFPALTQKVRGKPWVYLDSAASAIKPWSVIERISHFYTYQTANVHRGAFYIADQATGYFEEARVKVQNFIGAQHLEEIIFTKGTTESINLAAQCLGELILKPLDEILLTEMEHHANIVPWQMCAEKTGAKIKVLPITDSGELDLEKLSTLLTAKTKIVALTHCSNVLGTINDVKKITKLAHEKGAVVVVDGAQMVANHPIDVKDLDADFYCFSGHKIFGPYGIGVLYGKKAWLEKMSPYQGGGSMINEVRFEKTTYNDLPYKFEAGTPHIEGVIGLGAAIDYVQKLGFANIESHDSELLKECTEKVQAISGVEIFGRSLKKAPIISLLIEGAHPSDVAQILDQENIAIRAGHLCAQPLMRRLKTQGFVRVSMSVFNNSADIDLLVKGLIKAKEMLI